MNAEEFEEWIKHREDHVFLYEDVRALYERLTAWTPVTEALPKEGNYEVTHGISSLYCTVREVCWCEFRCDAEKPEQYRWNWYELHTGKPVLYVLAWRPLPEPWEG